MLAQKIKNLAVDKARESEEAKKTFYYAPRIFGIIFSFFLFSFLIEAFSKGFDFSAILFGVMPGLIFLLLVVFAWKHDLMGGWAILFYSFIYFLFLLAKKEPIAGFLLVIPITFTGALFLYYEYVFKHLKAKRKGFGGF